jgi:ABC-type polysaccharide/polyol phosphate transport system ATPase subunit
MSDKVAISVKHVNKSFKLPHEKYTGLKQAVLSFKPGKKYEMQHVLKGISFDIKEGEFFGIVGRNGSGKSTLLKLLAQIYTPDHGSVAIDGSLTPFIELGVGFNPELTGRENVYLNGALLGFDRKQVSQMYPDIVQFAEIENFMDQKLKNYSSGMQVRLAFSIAIRAESDILLIDEVLAVGDAAFQQKCFKYFENLKRQKRTIVFVSHDMSSVKEFCDRAVIIDKGEIKQIGKPVDIAKAYDRLNFEDEVIEQPTTNRPSDGPELLIYDAAGHRKSKFEYGQPIIFEVTWPKSLDVGIAGFVIIRGTEMIFATNSIDQDANLSGNHARLQINPLLGNGRYQLSAGLFGKTRYDHIATVDSVDLMIYGQPDEGDKNDEWEGLMYVPNKWE